MKEDFEVAARVRLRSLTSVFIRFPIKQNGMGRKHKKEL